MTCSIRNLCPDAHAAQETWQSSIRFSAALNGCHGAMIGHSVAPDDCLFVAEAGRTLKVIARSTGTLSRAAARGPVSSLGRLIKRVAESKLKEPGFGCLNQPICVIYRERIP
jgi:hypothetical protein